MDPVNTLFWNLVSGWKNPKTPPLCSRVDGKSVYFLYRWRHRSTSSLRPLNPATSHNNSNNNNNNGGQHACVGAAEDIEPIRVTRAKYSAALLLRWAEKVYGWLTRHFLLLLVFGLFFYCLFVYSMQALCTCSISSSLFLVNFKRHLQTRMWTTACWVVYNGSIRTQISLKRCRGRWREKKVILVHVDKD